LGAWKEEGGFLNPFPAGAAVLLQFSVAHAVNMFCTVSLYNCQNLGVYLKNSKIKV
jgi:hypothetical protein